MSQFCVSFLESTQQISLITVNNALDNINMDADLLKGIVFDLITSGRTTDGLTKQFATMKHNADLLPKICEKLELILDYFYKYRELVCDVQGVRDHGVDIVLKFEADDGSRKIGFQVKSFDDIKAEDWQTKLKAQMFEAQGYHSSSMDDFYILFCSDIEQHRDKIRNAMADLTANTQFNCHPIRPQQVLHFLKLGDAEIGAYIKRRLSKYDYVFAEAVESLDRCSLIEGALVIDGLIELIFDDSDLTAEKLYDSHIAQSVTESYPHNSVDSLDDAITSVIDKGFFAHETYTGKLTLNEWSTNALAAVAYDAKVRYNYGRDDLKSYLFHSLMADQIDDVTSDTAECNL